MASEGYGAMLSIQSGTTACCRSKWPFGALKKIELAGSSEAAR